MTDIIKRIQPQKFLALGALVILYVFFAIFGQNFVSTSTHLNILAQSYFVGFLAIGVTFVILSGGIDLSIGTVMMCSAVVGGLLYRQFDLPLWLCLIIVVLIGTTFGLFNGLMVTKLGLPPFISTLGTMMIAMGLGSILTNTRTQSYPSLLEADAWFGRVFLREGNFPTGAVWLLVIFILAMILLNKTKLGRYTYAIGSNEEAVRLSGVNASSWKCMIYVISGFFAGVAAIFFAAAYTAIIPGQGQGNELQAIAAVVIGGTSLAGGIGSLSGTIIGVFIMSVLRTGLMSIGLPAPYQNFFTGVVVIAAVWLDIQRTKRANQVKKEKQVVQKTA
ncbi:MAG: ABC transporter permease [Oscillospiraceae bacterium]|nr:ABC transporter permease [Oscillospiraceae bacterium]